MTDGITLTTFNQAVKKAVRWKRWKFLPWGLLFHLLIIDLLSSSLVRSELDEVCPKSVYWEEAHLPKLYHCLSTLRVHSSASVRESDQARHLFSECQAFSPRSVLFPSFIRSYVCLFCSLLCVVLLAKAGQLSLGAFFAPQRLRAQL